MREIKFRVWNKVLEKFDPAGLPITHNSEKGIFGIDKSYVEHFVVQQYTGLKDEKGVEIYEGDYVHRADVPIGFVEYGRVLHSNTGLAYLGFYLRKDKDNYTHIDGTLEVIGNIFEGVDK